MYDFTSSGVTPTRAFLSSPQDAQDESDLYFGAENPDFDEDDVESDTGDGNEGYLIDNEGFDGSSESKSEE